MKQAYARRVSSQYRAQLLQQHTGTTVALVLPTGLLS